MAELPKGGPGTYIYCNDNNILGEKLGIGGVGGGTSIPQIP